MAATSRNDRRLSDEQLGELITLLKDVDTVELKLTVPQADQRAVVTGLQVDPLEAQIRQVFFFDTPDLALNKAGVVLRARRVQQKGDDSVVKLRPVVPSNLSEVVRRSPGFGVEVDAMPGGFVCSASMKGAPTGSARPRSGSARCGSSSRRSNASSMPRTRPRESRSTTCRSSAPSSSSS